MPTHRKRRPMELPTNCVRAPVFMNRSLPQRATLQRRSGPVMDDCIFRITVQTRSNQLQRWQAMRVWHDAIHSANRRALWPQESARCKRSDRRGSSLCARFTKTIWRARRSNIWRPITLVKAQLKLFAPARDWCCQTTRSLIPAVFIPEEYRHMWKPANT